MKENTKKDLYFLIFILIITIFNTILCCFLLTRNLNRRTYCYINYKDELRLSNLCKYDKCLNIKDDSVDLAKDFILLGGGNNDR